MAVRKATSRPRAPRRALVPVALALVSFVLLTAGCKGQIADICDRECECQQCSDDELDECIADGKMIESDSKDAGCTMEFETYSDCADDNLVCENGNSRVDGCTDEKAALTACYSSADPS